MGDDLKEIIDPVIKRNGYFGHPEGILLAMLKDQRSHIKQLALSCALYISRSKPGVLWEF